MGVPVLLNVRGVQPPEVPGGAALIRVAVVPHTSPLVQPQDDMAVAISLSKGSSDMIAIPAISVARGAGSQSLVAVLHEVSESPASPHATPGKAVTEDAPKLDRATSAPLDEIPPKVGGAQILDVDKASSQVLEERGEAEPAREHLFEIEWRSVALSDALPAALGTEQGEVGSEGADASGKMKKVISGLEPGDRILRDASQWQGRFVSTPGKPLRVRLLLNAS
jgi:hypothetical protein